MPVKLTQLNVPEIWIRLDRLADHRNSFTVKILILKMKGERESWDTNGKNILKDVSCGNLFVTVNASAVTFILTTTTAHHWTFYAHKVSSFQS